MQLRLASTYFSLACRHAGIKNHAKREVRYFSVSVHYPIQSEICRHGIECEAVDLPVLFAPLAQDAEAAGLKRSHFFTRRLPTLKERCKLIESWIRHCGDDHSPNCE
jgi:hypothetical protein